MRYTLGIGLAGLVLLAAIGLVVSNSPATVVAGKDVPPGANSSADRYAPPAEADAAAFVRFVQELDDLAPASKPARRSSRFRPTQHAHSELEPPPVSDPQMVFKMCVPVESLRRLTRP